jgi:hypothetical protein
MVELASNISEMRLMHDSTREMKKMTVWDDFWPTIRALPCG